MLKPDASLQPELSDVVPAVRVLAIDRAGIAVYLPRPAGLDGEQAVLSNGKAQPSTAQVIVIRRFGLLPCHPDQRFLCREITPPLS